MNVIFRTACLLTALVVFSVAASAQLTAEESYQKGMEIMSKGRYVEALPFFDEAINLNSKYVEALLARSRARSNNQADLKGAMADLETVLQIKPQMGEAYFERAMIRNAMIHEMFKGKEMIPTEELKPHLKIVLEDLNAAIDNGFKNKRSYSVRAGMLSREFDNQAEAVKDYTEAIKYDPDDAHLLINRSVAKRRNNDAQGAMDDLREIVRRYDEAKNNAQTSPEKLGTLKGAAIMALNNLSSTYALEEKPDLQLWALAKSIELQPNHSAYASLARHKIIFGSLEEALADYTKAIELSGEKIGAYFMDRAIVYLLMEKPAEAEADFEQGRKLEPSLKYYNQRYWLELSRRQREQKRVRVELPK